MTDQSDDPIDETSLESRLRWMRLEALTNEAYLACIDGRFEDCEVGAPGGDTGELVALLAAVEQAIDEPVADEDVQEIVSRSMETHGRFYLHTDRAALDRLEATLRADEAAKGALEEAGSIDAFVRRPPEPLRERLGSLLVEPDHTGCGHLQTMLRHTDEYDVRRGLVEATVRAFFEQLWRGRRQAYFVVLEGEHTEEAIVAFETDGPIDASVRIPAVCRKAGEPSLFINHLPAHRFMRQRTLELVAELLGLGEETRRTLRRRTDELAGRFAEVTVSHLAPELPVYEVAFEGDEIALHSGN